MMKLHKVIAIALTAVAALFTAPSASASQGEELTPQASGCIGSSFAGTLTNQKAICNGNFLVRMQGNGDLVLRQISSGRACWSTNTAGAWTNDAYAVFTPGGFSGQPKLTVNKTSQGQLYFIWGYNRLPAYGTNANVNARGEFWVGYRKIASC